MASPKPYPAEYKEYPPTANDAAEAQARLTAQVPLYPQYPAPEQAWAAPQELTYSAPEQTFGSPNT